MTRHILFDSRWSGPYGIGRFSAEVRRRDGAMNTRAEVRAVAAGDVGSDQFALAFA